MKSTNLKYPEEKILSISKTTLTIAQDHEAELSKFGINAVFLAAFALAIVETEGLFDENKERYELKILTAIKNEALDRCYLWCRDVYVRIKLAFEKDSKEVQSFPSKILADADDSEKNMSPVMETIIVIATEHETVLANFGQDAAMLAEGTSLLNELREADKNQQHKKVSKKEATQIRHKMFNNLVTYVNKINKVGRIVFKDDLTKYVLFESPWGSHSGPNVESYKGEIQPSANLLLAEELDVDFSIYMENTGETDLVFFSGIKSEENPGITLSPGEEATLNLQEIGDGDNLSVENLSHNKTGAYTVKIKVS